MADPHNQNLSIDSGQLHRLNALDSTKSVVTNLETLKSVHKQVKNPCLNNHMEIEEINDESSENAHDTAGTRNDINNEQEAKKRYLTIKMELEPEREATDDEHSAMVLHATEELSQAWDHDKIIQDAYDLDGRMLERKYSELDSWAIIPRIVKKKKYATVETIIQVKTKASACRLYQNQKEYFYQNNISISRKRTGLEYTKKVRFLAGTYVKLASVDYHIDEIIDKMELDSKSIDIKKRFTYERNSRSKALSICAVHEEADQIDNKLLKLKSPR